VSLRERNKQKGSFCSCLFAVVATTTDDEPPPPAAAAAARPSTFQHDDEQRTKIRTFAVVERTSFISTIGEKEEDFRNQQEGTLVRFVCYRQNVIGSKTGKERRRTTTTTRRNA